MEKINSTLLEQLTGIHTQPCISLYMPTHRVHPESATDPIRFKNLVKKIQHYITENTMAAYQPLLEPIENVQDDLAFWNNNDCGLAILVSQENTHIIRLPEPVEEVVYVAESFYVKPLFKFNEYNMPYYLLAIAQDSVKFYSGDKYRLTEVDIKGKIPTHMTEALGEELTNDHTHAASAPNTGVHGYMEKSQEVGIDTERFFRSVDQALNSHFEFSPTRPLILAALAEHHTVYKHVSKNHYLSEHMITINASALTTKELLREVREVIDLEHSKKIESLLNRQRIAVREKLSSHELLDVVYDAIDGKIEILFLEDEKIISGNIDVENRKAQLKDDENTDILNELAYLVHQRGGEIILLDKEDMPYDSGVFTINRF